MAEKMLAGKTVQVNEEGFMTNPEEWNREIAAAIALEEEVGELKEGHWKVIEYLQKEFKENGVMPSLRRVTKTGGIPTK